MDLRKKKAVFSCWRFTVMGSLLATSLSPLAGCSSKLTTSTTSGTKPAGSQEESSGSQPDVQEPAVPGPGTPGNQNPDCIDLNPADVAADGSFTRCDGTPASGTLKEPDPCQEGGSGCVVTEEQVALNPDGIAPAKLSDQTTVAGIQGTGAPECVSEGQIDCRTTNSLASGGTLGSGAPDPQNIRAGAVVAGVSGSMRYCKSAGDISFADSPDFPTNLAFENFNAAAVTADHTLDTFTGPTLILDSGVPVRLGGTAVPAGLIAGTVYYTVSVNSTTFKLAATQADALADSPATIDFTSNGTAVRIYGGKGGNLSIHDTIDRGNFQQGSGAIGRLGPDSPYGSRFHCTESEWELVAPSPNGTSVVAGNASHCDEASDDCMIRDKLTGLIWAEVITATAMNYGQRVNHCKNLTSGNLGGWRLATYKDLVQAYVNGIAVIAQYPHFGSYAGKWVGSISSTSLAANQAHAIGIYLDNYWAGSTDGGAKTGTIDRIFCIRQGPAGELQ